jgi:hypothetical protein
VTTKDPLYAVVRATKTQHGILWWKRFTFEKETVAQALDLRGAIDYAIEFPMWANDAVSVQANGQTFFSKAGRGMRDW